MRTIVTFESAVSNTRDERPYFVNPECFGDDVARWLAARLRADGVRADAEPGREDFGWYFDFDVPEGRHCCLLGFQPGDRDEPGRWVAWTERNRGFVASLLGLRRYGIAPAAVDALRRALTGAPEVRNVLWYPRASRGAGPLGPGAADPRQP